MASPSQWTWVWVGSGTWWYTGRPGMLQFIGSQRVEHDRATELNWTELNDDRQCFSQRQGTRQRCLLSPLLLNIVLEFLAKAIQQESEIESIALGNKAIKLFLHRDIILYGQNTKKSTERLLEAMNVYQGHMIKSQFTKIYKITLQ